MTRMRMERDPLFKSAETEISEMLDAVKRADETGYSEVLNEVDRLFPEPPDFARIKEKNKGKNEELIYRRKENFYTAIVLSAALLIEVAFWSWGIKAHKEYERCVFERTKSAQGVIHKDVIKEYCYKQAYH